MSNKPTAKIESVADLCKRQVIEPNYVVPGLIAAGMNLLCSPPKYGKSWMMLDLAYSVATGTDFLDIPTHQTGVLYLALEDSDARMQSRMRQVAAGREIPPNFFFALNAPTLDDGLVEWLGNTLDASPYKIGLVIVDTLQKVRGIARRTEGVYGYDYRELGALKSFLDERGLCGVFVHHLNKNASADSMDRVNGTAGVAGAVDTIITLTRSKHSDSETRMSVTGRDVPERTVIIKMDWSTFRWNVLGTEKDVEAMHNLQNFHEDPIIKTIVGKLDEQEKLLFKAGQTNITPAWTCTSVQILEEASRRYGKQTLGPTAVGKKVKAYQTLLMSEEGITYEYRRTSETREHVFTREIV